MKKILLLALLVATCCKTVEPPKPEPSLDWKFYFGSVPTPPASDPIVADAMKRSVVIISASGACSGGIGSTGTVLTAAHCYPETKNKDIFVNGSLAKVMFRSKELDIMFLHVLTDDFKPLDFAEPKVDDEIFVVMTQNQYRSVVKRGHVTHIEDGTFSTDIMLIPGASGCFVYSKDGKLEGIVNIWDAMMSHCVSAKVIRGVLGL